MADIPLKYVNYGHPGISSYDLDNREWAFARQYTPLQLRQIQTIASTHSATTLAIAPARFPLPQTSATRTEVRKRTKGLVESNPHLSPAAGLLPDLALLSAAISSTASAYDPLVGSLFSFGSITLGNKYETPRRVAALATGEARNILQLALLNKEIYDWGEERKTWVEGPTLKDAQFGYWNEEAAPIQQICFSESEDRSCLLAVRLPTRTVLLRPIYHRQARMFPSSSFYHFPASVIEPHPVLNIHQKDTGGSPHVDFTFNPDYQLQFALVDQNQTWSVWDIHHPRKGDKYSPSCLAKGRINKPEDDDAPSQDGWARILWVANIHTLLVCNRRHLCIIDIRRRSHTYLPCPSIINDDNERAEDWILDIKRHPKDKSQFFVLTSSQLALMTITTSSEANTSADEAVATVLQSWEHYRSVEDVTLQIEVQLLSDEESFVIVHSSLNDLIQVYSFSESLPGFSGPVARSDPSLLNLSLDKSAEISKLHILPMQQEGMQIDINFFRLFLTQSDGGVQELVVYSSTLESTRSSQVVKDFEQSTIKLPRAGISKKALVGEEDDFVVPDRLAFAGAPCTRITSQIPRLRSTSETIPARYLRDHRPMIPSLLRPEIVNEISDSVEVVHAANEVQQMLVDGLDCISKPLGTLMEHANMKIVVLDVDKASSEIEKLFSLQNRHENVEIRHIASANLLDLTEDGGTTISEVYDNILEKWIAPLPPEVPVRVRHAKERLAQRIAAELVLSSTTVREHGLGDQITGSQYISSQEFVATLPVLPSQAAALHSSSQLFSSQTLPTPPPSSLPGSSPPITPSTSSIPSDPLTRLGMHLRRQESPQPLNIANSISQLRAHWQTGADPRTYDWVTTERNLQPEAIDEASQQQRKKERKRRERREKRQQREDERVRSVAMGEPISFPRSSPGPMLGGMGSSSQVLSHVQNQSQLPIQSGGFMIPQSQTERGRFGGRLEKKKKKKGRISGF